LKNIFLEKITACHGAIFEYIGLVKFNENIGDEFHYLLICKSPELVRIRENLIPEYYTRYPKKTKIIRTAILLQ
jgi:hypothetical protein